MGIDGYGWLWVGMDGWLTCSSGGVQVPPVVAPGDLQDFVKLGAETDGQHCTWAET